MTPYQRGHRDSLLNLAALLDGAAKARATLAESVRTPLPGSSVAQLRDTDRASANAYQHAADMARRQAEMMPDDPGVADE